MDADAEFDRRLAASMEPLKALLSIAPETIYNPQRFDRPEPHPSFSAPNSCTGNCKQGRACDCVPDVDDTAGRSDRIPEGGGLVIAVAIVAFAVIAALVGQAILDLWVALKSGWRAGKKQARKRWTELRKARAASLSATAGNWIEP